MNATRYADQFAEVPSFSDPRGSSTDGTPLSQILHATSPRIEGHFPLLFFLSFPFIRICTVAHATPGGGSFLFFLLLFFPISQSRITTRPDIDLFYRICWTFVFLPGIRNERRRGCLSLLLCILHPRSCHFAGEFVSRILRWLSVFISFFIFMFSSLFFSCLAFFCEFSFTRNFSVILLTFFSNLNDYRATTRKGKLSFLVDTIFIFSVNFSAILRFCSLLYISSSLSKILYFSLLLLTKFQSESIQNSTHFHFIHSPLFVCFPIIGVIVSQFDKNHESQPGKVHLQQIPSVSSGRKHFSQRGIRTEALFAEVESSTLSSKAPPTFSSFRLGICSFYTNSQDYEIPFHDRTPGMHYTT